MSNIYNLQQVSLNSRIVAVEGTFDHIDANNVNAENINGANVTLNAITIKEINAEDPIDGICINDKILIDEINEKTLNNGVVFPQKIKVDTIESNVNSEVSIENIKVATLEVGALTNQILLERPIAFNLVNEYQEATFNLTNVLAVDKAWDSLTSVNSGFNPYLPVISGNNIIFQEAGVYQITVNFLPSSGFLSTDILYLRFRDPVIPQSDNKITSIQIGGGAPGGTASFTFGGFMLPEGVDPISNNYEITAIRLAGASNISGTGRIIITRIK